MPDHPGKNELLDVVEVLLKAQLKAVRQLRNEPDSSDLESDDPNPHRKRKRMSHTDMAIQVLTDAGGPLHIMEIVEGIKQQFGAVTSRESLVSAIVKKVAQRKDFVKTDRNTYGLLGRDKA